MTPPSEVPRGLRVREHFAAVDGSARERKRLARVYDRMGDAERAKAADSATLAALSRFIEEKAERRMRIAAGLEDREAFDGAYALGESVSSSKAEAAAAAFELEADRRAKAASSVRSCCAGLFKRKATKCMDGCAAEAVSRCNRIGCPLCARARAAELVREWAPKLRELEDRRTLTFTIPNVSDGELAAGVDLLHRAFGVFRRSAWFRARWDGGFFSTETTRGRPPRETWERDRRGRPVKPKELTMWHPHLHCIVGNLERAYPEAMGPFNDGVFSHAELAREWSEAVERAKDPTRARRQRQWERIDRLEREGRSTRLLRAKAGDRPADAPQLIVWIDALFSKRKVMLESGRVRWERIYERDARTDEERESILESATREALKYIAKGIGDLEVTSATELILAKERTRWLQGFGTLHATGVRACRECRAPREAAAFDVLWPMYRCPCGGKAWRLRDRGEACPCCKAIGETMRELEESDGPSCCPHGHEYDAIEFETPPREEWARRSPVGLAKPRPRGPPERTGTIRSSAELEALPF